MKAAKNLIREDEVGALEVFLLCLGREDPTAAEPLRHADGSRPCKCKCPRGQPHTIDRAHVSVPSAAPHALSNTGHPTPYA